MEACAYTSLASTSLLLDSTKSVGLEEFEFLETKGTNEIQGYCTIITYSAAMYVKYFNGGRPGSARLVGYEDGDSDDEGIDVLGALSSGFSKLGGWFIGGLRKLGLADAEDGEEGEGEGKVGGDTIEVHRKLQVERKEKKAVGMVWCEKVEVDVENASGLRSPLRSDSSSSHPPTT